MSVCIGLHSSMYNIGMHVELCFSDSGEGGIDSTVIEEREVYG